VEVRVEDGFKGISEFVRAQAGRVVRETAQAIAMEAQASMRGPKSGRLYGEHRASAPGEAPAIQSGELVGSVRPEMVGEQEAIVGADADYVGMLEYGTLEMAARPFMTPAAERARPKFTEAMTRLLDE
jgi:HK97 gp10 family phage protein